MKNCLFVGFCILSVLESFAQDPISIPLKAKVLLEQKKYDSALDILTNRIPDQKKDFFSYKETGDGWYFKNNYLLALSFYLKADSINKNRCSFEISRCYAGIGEGNASLQWLEKHLSGNQKKKEVEIISDPIFSTLSKTTEWKNFWKKNWYTESEIEVNAITALLQNGKADKAMDELEEYRGNFSPRHFYYALQAKIYQQQNQPEQALLSINQAIGLHPTSDAYLFDRATINNSLKKYEEALTDLTNAIQMNSLEPTYYLKRAQVALKTSNLNMAESDITLFQELYPDSVETYYQRALLEKAKGNHLTSLEYFDKVLGKDVTKPLYFLERGTVAFEVKQIEKADIDFGMALDLDPKLTDAYLQKGKTRLILQDLDGACYCWKKAKQYGSNEAAKLIYQNCKE